ncbi:hypothetical protein D3C75_1185460 [compost metagenome]
MSSEVRRASHTHQVPHMGLPQAAPVKRAMKVNTAPTGAMAATVMSAMRSCHTSPMKAATAMVE